jgi:monoamine oxidase
MLDTAIIGGGLCGLALADLLHKDGRDFVLFESRNRWGGRILSYPCKLTGLAVDLGAAWFWPDRNPLLATLAGELGLETFVQHDSGEVLRLADAEKKPETVDAPDGIHGGARRVSGGVQQVIDGLRARLPADKLHLESTVLAIRDLGDAVELTVKQGDKPRKILARRVVLALPPRLAEERIAITPDWDASVRQAMSDAPTWMAQQAKALATFDKPVWRDAGQSGNAFVSHERAVIGEIFDACDDEAKNGALGGFVALDPAMRRAFATGMPLLLRSQFEQVFGADLAQQGEFYQDWAGEGATCSARDLEKGAEEARASGNPLLRRPLWSGRLFIAGSETAARHPGYMEGALETARRVALDILRQTATPADAERRDGESVNEFSLRTFAVWVETHGASVFEDYRRRLNAALSTQQREQLTQIATLGAVEDFFAKALETLRGLSWETSDIAVEKGRSALTPAVQKPFGNFLRDFFEEVAAFNGTSCALSNFPEEAHWPRDYKAAILRDCAAAWTEFSLDANRLLLDHASEPANS